jgi:hypothetical protein
VDLVDEPIGMEALCGNTLPLAKPCSAPAMPANTPAITKPIH